MKNHARALLTMGLILSAAACGDDSGTGPGGNTGENGSVSFAATGGVQGNFNASGRPDIEDGGPAERGTWAAGVRAPEGLGVLGFKSRSASRADYFILAATATQTGTYEIDTDCLAEDGNCTGVMMLYNAPVDSAGIGTMCVLESGSVKVTQLTNTRAKGTFSGEGWCLDEDAAQEGGEPEAWEISNGAFDVGLLAADGDIALQRTPAGRR